MSQAEHTSAGFLCSPGIFDNDEAGDGGPKIEPKHLRQNLINNANFLQTYNHQPGTRII